MQENEQGVKGTGGKKGIKGGKEKKRFNKNMVQPYFPGLSGDVLKGW